MEVKPNRTMIPLPVDLFEAIDRAVREGSARSREAFIVAALRRELAIAEGAALDAAIAPMAEDGDYQAEARMLSEEFAAADWEALRLAEPGGGES